MNNLYEEQFIKDILQPFHHIHTFDNGNSIYLGSQSVVGGFPDKWNYTDNDYENVHQTLISKNIKAIVCCADLIKLFEKDFEYLHIPMESNDNFDITEPCNKAWPWITKMLKEGSILIHCNAGCHRSATIVVGYLCLALNMNLEDSYNYVRLKRSCFNLDNFEG